MRDARTRDPLDVVLCHGCARVVEVVTHTDDGIWYSAVCPCGCVLVDGTDHPPLTVRQWVQGVDRGETRCDVRMGRLLPEIVRRLAAGGGAR